MFPHPKDYIATKSLKELPYYTEEVELLISSIEQLEDMDIVDLLLAGMTSAIFKEDEYFRHYYLLLRSKLNDGDYYSIIDQLHHIVELYNDQVFFLISSSLIDLCLLLYKHCSSPSLKYLSILFYLKGFSLSSYEFDLSIVYLYQAKSIWKIIGYPKGKEKIEDNQLGVLHMHKAKLLAMTIYDKKQQEAFKEELNKAIQVFKQLKDNPSIPPPIPFHQLGTAFLNLEDFTKAETNLLKAINLWGELIKQTEQRTLTEPENLDEQKKLAQFLQNQLFSLTSLIDLYFRIGDTESAHHYLKITKEKCQTLGNSFFYAFANIFLAMNSANPLPILQEILCNNAVTRSNFNSLDIKDNPNLDDILTGNTLIFRALDEKAKYLKSLKKYQQAFECYELIIRLSYKMQKGTKNLFSKYSNARHIKDLCEHALECLDIGDKEAVQKALPLIEYVKGKILADKIEQKSDFKSYNEGDWIQELQQVSDPSTFDDNFQKLLALEYLDKKRFNTPVYNEWVNQIVVPDDSFILSIFVGKRNICFSILQKEGAELISIPKPDDFSQLVKNVWKAANKNHAADLTSFIDLIKPLSELFITPLLAYFKKHQKCYIVLDEEIANLPFELLLTNNKLSEDFAHLPYLINECEIAYLYSLHSKPVQQTKFDIDLWAWVPRFYEQFASLQLDDWAMGLKQKIKESEVSLGEDASKNELVDTLQNRSIETVLLISHTKELNKKNRLLNLGIVCDLKKDKDAIIYWDEISSLRINTQLLITLCCDTVHGEKIIGEGQLSITRAFIAAGAQSVLQTLFRVYNEPSKRLIEQFLVYNKEEANLIYNLAKVKRQMIADNEPPKYWAGFTLIQTSY